MRYLEPNTICKWELVPLSLPTLTRSCPKCGKASTYKNTQRFRINANKKHLDVWLIYQCHKCKSTYNLAIFERINPSNIDADLLQRLQQNDALLAWQYGFDKSLHAKNKIQLNLNDIDYDIQGPTADISSIGTSAQMEIHIHSPYDLNLRLDSVLSKKLQLSRSQIKRQHELGRITGLEGPIDPKTLIREACLIRINASEPIQPL